MYDTLADEIHPRMADKVVLATPPPDFPVLPDLPIGRYTDPEFGTSMGSWTR